MNIIDYLILAVWLISFATAMVSGFAMANYLGDRNFFNSFFSLGRPDIFFVYRDKTKEEYGKTGIWYYLFIYSILSGVFFSVLFAIFVGHAEEISNR